MALTHVPELLVTPAPAHPPPARQCPVLTASRAQRQGTSPPTPAGWREGSAAWAAPRRSSSGRRPSHSEPQPVAPGVRVKEQRRGAVSGTAQKWVTDVITRSSERSSCGHVQAHCWRVLAVSGYWARGSTGETGCWQHGEQWSISGRTPAVYQPQQGERPGRKGLRVRRCKRQQICVCISTTGTHSLAPRCMSLGACP